MAYDKYQWQEEEIKKTREKVKAAERVLEGRKRRLKKLQGFLETASKALDAVPFDVTSSHTESWYKEKLADRDNWYNNEVYPAERELKGLEDSLNRAMVAEELGAKYAIATTTEKDETLRGIQKRREMAAAFASIDETYSEAWKNNLLQYLSSSDRARIEECINRGFDKYMPIGILENYNDIPGLWQILEKAVNCVKNERYAAGETFEAIVKRYREAR